MLAMIEIEKKFLLDVESKARLIDGAEFLGSKTVIDVLYDAADYRITCSDSILRERNGRFELKVSVHDNHNAKTRLVDQYRELETETEIRGHMEISKSGTLKEDLKRHGVVPCFTLTTIRERYRNGEFAIDIDSVDFGFDVVEIELMVEDKAHMQEALEKIIAFAASRGLTKTPHGGKYMEYIRRHRLEHYAALVRSGVAGEP